MPLREWARRIGASTHLNDVGMSYGEHLFFSLSLGNAFLGNAMCAYGHAIFPFLWTDASSDGLAKIRKMMNDKRAEVNVRYHKERMSHLPVRAASCTPASELFTRSNNPHFKPHMPHKNS